MPELLRDGRTGFLVADVPAAVQAVGRLATIDRGTCRRDAVTRFAAGRMIDDYLALFERIRLTGG
jgi:hypothetical protein